MQVLVKNGDRLYSLGEGKIYSKKQVKLKEGLDASIGTANGVQQAQMKAKNAMAQPNVTSASGDLGKMDGQNDSNTGEGVKIQLPVNASTQQLNNVQSMAKNSANDDMEVEFVKNDASTNNGTNESIQNKKLVEMRRNSVSFTKKELSDFLASF